VLALAAVLSCLACSGSAAADGTSLRITVWPEGRERRAARVRTLRCGPAGGTLSRPARACRRLTALDAPFRPVPEDIACTQIYGGPQEARVVGTFRGRRIWVTFRRTDGCEIGRWNRVAFLFG
jgi:hypothetical protein